MLRTDPEARLTVAQLDERRRLFVAIAEQAEGTAGRGHGWVSGERRDSGSPRETTYRRPAPRGMTAVIRSPIAERRAPLLTRELRFSDVEFTPPPARKAAFLLLVGALQLGGCGRAPRPDLVLVTVDTLRPDALGWVAGRNETPAIDALAREGFAFPGAVSPVPLTLPSHVSILTGLVPRRHGVRDNGQTFGGSIPTLSERLGAAGYRTGAFVSGYPLRRMFGLDRGFEIYHDELASRPDGRWQDRPASATTALALEWLRGVKKRDPDQPFFLWIHYYDPHTPYAPPARFSRPGPRGAYDGEVAAVDQAVAPLRLGLEETFPSRRRLTLLTADHGEALGEHGEATHGFFIYDSTTLVPLLFHGPNLIPRGSSPAAVRLIDIAPTVLELLEVEPLAEIDGQSVTAIWRNEPFEVAPALIESRQPFDRLRLGAAHRLAQRRTRSGSRRRSRSSTTSHARCRRAREPRRERPARATSCAASSPTSSASRSLAHVRGRATTPRSPPPCARWATSEARPPLPPSRPPVLPIRRTSCIRRSSSTWPRMLARRAAIGTEALALFDVVLAAEPDNRYALLRSGQTLAHLGQLAEAISLLEDLLALDPGQTEARFALADALGRSDKPDAAMAQWMALLERQPRRAIAWCEPRRPARLRRGDLEQAESALARALALDERNPQLRRNLAECRYQQALAHLARNDPRTARAKLAAALEVLPDLRLRAASDPRLAPLLDSAATAEGGTRARK